MHPATRHVSRRQETTLILSPIEKRLFRAGDQMSFYGLKSLKLHVVVSVGFCVAVMLRSCSWPGMCKHMVCILYLCVYR